MKFFEVRKEGRKYWIKGREIYSGPIDFRPALVKNELEFYSLEFDRRTYPPVSISAKKLEKMGLKITKPTNGMESDLHWILFNSDHRSDVRIVPEEFLEELKAGIYGYTKCEDCEHIFSEHPISLPRTYIKATTAIHQLGDISRPGGDYAVVSEADEENYYGMWVTGYGFCDVAFPKSSCVIVDKSEVPKVVLA